ncbi:MAG: ATP synthase F1 subunit epsilon [Patescibacteria group bacterium]|jgi:F-type H+-transporting ATPase subunit epsilon
MSDVKLHYTVATPERIVYEGDADSISVMTGMGEITVLPHHAPLLALLKAGEMRVKHNGTEELLATSTGMFEVRQDGTVVVLADTAERIDELELAAIEAAKARAQEAIKAMRNKNDVSYADAAAHLERELARYRVAMKKGKGRARMSQD